MIDLSRKYLSPEIMVLPFSLESVLCVSPGAGESEDVEYEDWD